MKKLFAILLFVLIGFNATDLTAGEDKPLVVIRFNKRVILFEDKLKDAVKKALKAKSSMSFQIDSFYSRKGRKMGGRTPFENANRKGSSVRDIIVNEMNVPSYRVNLNIRPANYGKNEIHIFVE